MIARRDWAETAVACLGDSTTWGDDGTGAGGPAIAWPARLGELLGMGRVDNFGKKGSRVAVTDDRDDSFVERWEAVPPDSDVILVLGGVNDFSRDVPLGEMGSRDVRTFYGALDRVAGGLAGRSPEAVVVLMTPCRTSGIARKRIPASDAPNARGRVEADYALAVREVAASYAMPVIDLFDSSTISPLLPGHRELYMPDGLHYSPAGYERLARRIAAGLTSLVG